MSHMSGGGGTSLWPKSLGVAGIIAVLVWVLLGACLSVVEAGCAPPPVDAPPGQEVVAIAVDFAQIKPPGPRVSVAREAGSLVVFDVRGAFTRSDGLPGPLEAYWYVDWSPDAPVEPVRQGIAVMTYVPCSAEFDPPPPGGGARPSERTISVVVSTAPLDDPAMAYLGVAPGQAVALHDWTVVFVGEEQCPP